jgi:hypothetical protein
LAVLASFSAAELEEPEAAVDTGGPGSALDVAPFSPMNFRNSRSTFR